MHLLSQEKVYEKQFRIHTSQIKKSDDKDNFHYQGASYWVLFKVLKSLPEHLKTKGFVDYGSGKGRALFCGEHVGFNYLIGVELDSELVKIAQQNLKQYVTKRKESLFEFYNENAITFEIPKDCGTFYFFNPFSENIMTIIAEKIKDYAIKNKQEVVIVYLNPLYKNCWLNHGFTLTNTIKTNRYTESLLFTYRP